MRFSVLCAFVCLALALGCNKKISTSDSNSTPQPTDNGMVKMVAYGEVVSLAPGETAKVGKTEAMVTFVGAWRDSRCPRGVDCFTEGEAFATVSLGDDLAQQKVRIDVNPKRISRLTMTGATVEVVGLDPYPEARVKIAPADRRLRVRIVKSAKM